MVLQLHGIVPVHTLNTATRGESHRVAVTRATHRATAAHLPSHCTDTSLAKAPQRQYCSS